jgi:P27 family predicted phage terminase small subunit
MKGRPPDPKRARRGTGHRPLAGHRPPLELTVPALDLPEPPAMLPPEGRETWRLVTGDLVQRGLVQADLPLVEMLVMAFVRSRQARAEIAKTSVLLSYEGRALAHPMLRVEKDTAATYLRLAETLGLSPAARVRLGLMQAAGQSILLTIAERVARAVAAGHEDT